VTGLPANTLEEDFRKWLGGVLSADLVGLIYHIAMEESNGSCYVSFVTHKAMREAKSKLSKTSYKRHFIEVSTPNVTRNDLVCTALNLPLTVDDGVPPLSFYLSKPDVVTNLICMVFVWLITVFDFYLIGFLVNTFDQIFLSCIASGVSEFVAQAFGGYIYEKVGVKKSLCASYATAAVGGFIMLTYGLNHQQEWIFPALVLFMKFGISSAFNITYVCHKGCFPTLFSTTSLGYCTFISRFFTAFTPMLASMDQYASVMLFAVTSTFGAFIVLQIRQINDDDYKYSPTTTSAKTTKAD